MSDAESDTNLDLESIFLEPPRPPSPEPTLATYSRTSSFLTQLQEDVTHDQWSEIEIRLVGSHPLWGHYLWNASRSFASYLDARPELYRGGSVLELGAGGGLPGLVTAKNGAASVFLTDYPDAALIENLKHNVERNVPLVLSPRVHVQGYIWGQSLGPILEQQASAAKHRGFDLVIMSDLIFNHSQHDALLKTAEQALRGAAASELEPCVLVFFSHHRPHLAHRDIEFFSKAQERGWVCHKILTEKFPPMFPQDSGEEEIRATVHGWRLTLNSTPELSTTSS